jgi:hypothetical protein
MFLDFTHGLRLRTGGEQGVFERVYGNPLTVGLEADANYDVTRFVDFHFWPFGGNGGIWQLNERTWTLNNLTAFRFGRVDGLLMRGCFTIGAAVSLEFYPSAAPTLINTATTNFHISDCYLDAANTSLKVSGTYAAGWRVSGHIVGGTMAHYDNAADETLVEAENIVIQSDFKEIQLVGVRLVASGGNRRGGYVNMNAANGLLNMNGCSVNEWDAGATSAPAFVQAGASSKIALNDMAFFSAANARLTPANGAVAGRVVSSGNVTWPGTTMAGNITAAFATPGTSSFVYGVRAAEWKVTEAAGANKFGYIQFRLDFTPTIGTGTGTLSLSTAGFPATIRQITELPVFSQGITFTGGRTQLMLRMGVDGKMTLVEYGAGLTFRNVDHANFTAANVLLFTSGPIAF